MIPSKGELEAKVLNIARLLRTSQWSEDDLVEFKSQWPPDNEMTEWARSIAAHCNAAIGHPVLWIIGLHERDGVTGTEHRDRARWFPALQKHFDDGVVPEVIHDINVAVEDKSVSAILFNTDRAPFVVKVPGFGSTRGLNVAKEVPWRAGTSARSANRQDLMRLLYGRKRPATIDVLSATVDTLPATQGQDVEHCHCVIEAYISPPPSTRFVWPFHRCGVRIIPVGQDPMIWAEVTLSDQRSEFPIIPIGNGPIVGPARRKSKGLWVSTHEAVIDGPCVLFLKASFGSHVGELPGEPLDLRCAMIDAEDGAATCLHIRADPVRAGQAGAWRFDRDHDVAAPIAGNPLLRALGIETPPDDSPVA